MAPRRPEALAWCAKDGSVAVLVEPLRGETVLDARCPRCRGLVELFELVPANAKPIAVEN